MASVSSYFDLGGGAVLAGIAPPAYVDDYYYYSQFGVNTAAAETVNSTATRLYYIPIFIHRTHTFEGAMIFNSGAGDNAETLRIGLYSDSAGLPSARQIDWGEITLTGASAIRELTGNVTVNRGYYWMAVHCNTAAGFYAYTGSVTAGVMLNLAADFGNLTVSASIGSGNAFRYVDTAYGALASSAVAPTATTSTAPLMALKG